MLGGEKVKIAEQTMGAEDFGYITQGVPSCLGFLGTHNPAAGVVAGLHTPEFKIDESILPIGSAMHVGFALNFLSQRIGGED